jgi:uncharacterized protein
MAISMTPSLRAASIGVATAALLVGAFSFGVSRGDAGSGSKSSGSGSSSGRAATLTDAQPGATRITVTGTGSGTGTPNQLILSMGVQVTGSTVDSALGQSNQAVRRVTQVLRARGVAGADIQTSDFNIWPNYQGNSQIPSSYTVSESLTATLTKLGNAGGQIEAAVHAGGNVVTVSNVSLNLTDTGSLLASARAAAVRDARAKATQFAKALGEPLGPVISISPVQTTYLQPYATFGTTQAASSKAVPVSRGSQKVSVSITVVYAA